MKTPTPVVHKSKKRLGRGYGSGKGGHTVGKGQKGQKTRKKLGIMFEGVKVKKSLIKRLPFLRGKSRFKARVKPIPLDLKLFREFPSGTVLNQEFVVKEGFVKESDVTKKGVKVLGNFDLTKKLTVNLPISNKASEKVIKAGGKVLNEAAEKI